MARRLSGPPRRPRNPVAKAVRTPQFRPRVVPDKRHQWPPLARHVVEEPEAEMDTADVAGKAPAEKG